MLLSIGFATGLSQKDTNRRELKDSINPKKRGMCKLPTEVKGLASQEKARDMKNTK